MKSMRPIPTTKEQEDTSETLVKLLWAVREGLQPEINRASPANEFVLLIMDGTSPLASLAPPHIRQGGARALAVKAVRRDDLVRSIERFYPTIAEGLKKPAKCGHDDHLEYLASVARGGVVECTVCDLGLKPVRERKRES